jgi:transposase-like protein
MYERRSRLTPRQQGKLIEHFVLGATARATSEVVGVNVYDRRRYKAAVRAQV